jgi:hypothetical protein
MRTALRAMEGEHSGAVCAALAGEQHHAATDEQEGAEGTDTDDRNAGAGQHATAAT